jgi:HK97 family phage major capsid protein
MTSKELREKRNKLIADARELVGAAVASGNPLGNDEKIKLDALRAEAASIGDLLRQAEELDNEQRAIVPESQRPGVIVTPDQAARDEAFKRFMLTGERREQSLTAAEGGYTVAPDISFYGKVISAMKDYSGVEKAPCTVLNTATGADLPIPTNDDTGNAGELVAEAGSHASGTAITLGQTTLKSYLYSSKIVKVSLQLLRDSEIAWEGFLAQKFGERLGRAKNTALTTGTGSSQPQGVQYIAHTGRTAATGNATSVTFDEVLRLFHSLDPAYRNSNCRWMFSDTTALILRLLKDGNGQYIWRSAVTDGSPDSLFGYSVIINPDMPTMAANLKPILFGDFSHYFVRNVSGIEVVRLNELYAANGQVGFMAFCRFDGALVDAANHPIVVLVNSAA